ncbi:hypothetical protein, partial [Limimaricola soesokkakensis]|uniref:hypothetical protein n=1 Tax=Limimaricola soesokkakensis TaxID=1343159 RepID=UPI0035130916
ASCSLIIPMICASVKRLFRIVCSFAIEQTLHQTEGSRGGQVSFCKPIFTMMRIAEFARAAKGAMKRPAQSRLASALQRTSALGDRPTVRLSREPSA